jgi:hypothetical protein
VRTTRRSVNLGGQKVVLPGVHRILKGGEDSIGAHEAIQRVYFNIGSCAEQCWVNHFADMRQVDPEQRGFGQTPFNIGQCRRDCPELPGDRGSPAESARFLRFRRVRPDRPRRRPGQGPSRRRTRPRATAAPISFRVWRQEFGKGAVTRVANSSSPRTARVAIRASRKAKAGRSGTVTSRLPTKQHPRKMRADFLGNDQPTAVTEVGTFRCRALHSNHKAGHLYMEYGFRHAAPAAAGRRHSRSATS